MDLENKVSPNVKYRRAEDNGEDSLYGVPTYTVDSVENLRFDTSISARYCIQDPGLSLPIDILLHPKNHQRLLVGLHGAENPAQSDLPKFQFQRSFLLRGESALFLADPTILQGKDMPLGWMAGNKDFHAGTIMARIVEKAAEALGVDETLLVGHSAGGFAAVLIGSKVPNSRAISINGQSIVDKYDTYTVNALRRNAFPECMSNDDMMNRYRDRLDLRAALMTRHPTSSFTFFSNPADDSSFSRLPHFPLLSEHLGLSADTGGRTEHGDAMVPIQWHIDPSKNPSAHALPGTVIPFIDLVLGDSPSIELRHEIDPTWKRSPVVT